MPFNSEREKAELRELNELREKFRRRTIAYGIARKRADKSEAEIMAIQSANKILAQGMVEILKGTRDMQSCDSCKEKYMDLAVRISKSNPTALRYAMQYLNAEDTFYFMKLIEDPDKTFQEDEALAKLMEARK